MGLRLVCFENSHHSWETVPIVRIGENDVEELERKN
jgi:hypothetical protein